MVSWLKFVFLATVLLNIVEISEPAIHSNVNVVGNTLAPDFAREEGAATSPCPPSHPYACAGGTKCAAENVKPSSGSESDCDGSILNTYSQCCPDSSVVCPHASRKCRDNLQAGAAFCPLSHPHACNNGKLCSKDPHKPLSSVQGCNGMAVKPSDTCCPDSSLPCSNWDSSLTCASNPEFGYICPSSHPYPCKRGLKCSKSPWKPTSGPDLDCNGRRLTKGSICCPTENVIDCGRGRRCKEYKSNSVITQIGPDFNDLFYFLNFRKMCISPPFHPHLVLAEKTAVGKFKGQLFTCGGTTAGDVYQTGCHIYSPTSGWSFVGNLPAARRRWPMTTVDEGTSAEKVLMSGGYNTDRKSNVYVYDGTSIFEDSDYYLPIIVAAHRMEQVDANRLLLAGGYRANNGKKNERIYVFDRTATNWTLVATKKSDCPAIRSWTVYLEEAYMACDGKEFMDVLDIHSYVFTRREYVGGKLIEPGMAAGQDLFVIYRVKDTTDNTLHLILRKDPIEGWSKVTAITAPHDNPKRPFSIVVPDDFMTC